VTASGREAQHIAKMLAKINGEPGGSGATKKPDLDPGLPKEESGRVKPGPAVSESSDSSVSHRSSVDSTTGEGAQEDKPSVFEVFEPDVREQPQPEQPLAGDGRSDEDSKPNDAVAPVPNVGVSIAMASAPANPAGDAAAYWPELLPRLELSGVAFNLASNCVLEKIEGNKCFLRLSEQHASLWNKNYEARIARAFSQHFDLDMEVEITLGEQDAETPAQFQARIKQEEIAGAMVTIQQDENVKRLLEDFDGKLLPDSVRPNQVSGD
jgi:DNA polymerase-3 subunit gamma/tau